MQVVWFKRDLRVFDHRALIAACERGPVLPLYILEPDLWAQPDMSWRHYQFLQDCLHELNQDLEQLGQPLIVRVGEATEVFEQLHQAHRIEGLWSHQETWNDWTYQRDRAVGQWAKANGILWHEPRQHGVVRILKDRNGWAAKWYAQMKALLLNAPEAIRHLGIDSEPLPSAAHLGLKDDGCSQIQKGGRREGLRLLNEFLYERGEGYTKEMSSPLTAFESCSRISAHLAFGVLSMKEVLQASEQRSAELKSLPKEIKGKWPSALRSFSGRLRWHCHFIQKLEDEPRLEFENLHRAYDGLREHSFNQAYFEAWASGRTGYPMIDACMRALSHTGWLNFRMRAMLMSFASYHLWLPWREPALHLARLFVDYEPGIHYSQVQMQSGTTGINSIRIYNPIKQGMDHDPEGLFIRRWIPELASMTTDCLHTPWLKPELMGDYPKPIVDEKQARQFAAGKLYGLRKDQTHRSEAKQIVDKHGSRKSGIPQTTERRKTKTPPKNDKQMDLPF